MKICRLTTRAKYARETADHYVTARHFHFDARTVRLVHAIIQQRTKEIGIRKVNGASISEILSMLNKRFLFWVVAAFIIAVPSLTTP